MKFKDYKENCDNKKTGVITAHNPMGRKTASDVNNVANKELEDDLKSNNLKYKKIKGVYNGNEEESFEIENITLDKLIGLAKKYKQKAVMWNGKLSKIR